MIVPLLLALAQTATTLPATPPAAAPSEKPQLICVVQHETGSRLSGQRVCRTKAEWDQMRSELRQEIDLKQGNKAR